MRPVLAFLTMATAAKGSASKSCDINAVENAGETVFRSVHESWPAEINYYQVPASQEDEFLKRALGQSQKAVEAKQKFYELGVPCQFTESTKQSLAAITADVERRLKKDKELFFKLPAHANACQRASGRKKKLQAAKANLRKHDPNFDDSPNLKMPGPMYTSLVRSKRKRRKDEL